MNPVLAALRKRELSTSMKVEDGNLIVTASQDCTPIAEHCKALHNAGIYGSSEMRYAAEIPKVIFEKYCNDNGVSFAEAINDPVHIRRIVNNPDNAAFRIWPGQI